MSRAFNLTAELNLRGPSNVRLIVADIRRQLGTITADVDVRVNPATARNLTGLNTGLTALNRTLAQTQANANNVTTAFNNMGRAIATFNNNVTNIQRNTQNAAAACNNLNTNVAQLNRNTGQAANQFEEFGRQSALAVRRFAAFATVTGIIYKFSNAISSATKEFIDFNKELVRVAQVTDSSLRDLQPLVNQITRLSSGLGVASKDLIQVSSTLAQAGLSARDTEKALKALALSALAPSFDNLNDTVEGSIALMRQFGISAGDLEDALGSVNAVAAKFAVEASDLITAIQRTGGVFATASKGVSEGKDALNEFLAVFTSIRATTRESAETIATGLRTIFTRIQRTDTIDALKQFGVTLTDLQGRFVGPYEAVKRLSEGLSRLDPRDLRFSQIVEELGGFRQIGKVIPLIQQFATAQQALKVAQEGQGSLAKDAATAQQSVANRILKVREEFNALVRSIGQSDSFQTFVKLSLDLASALIKLADSAKTVLPALTAIATIRGVSALGSFATGFAGGLRRQHFGGPVRGFATGGYVPGVGNGDTVPAMLTPGEFVIRKKAVESLGVQNLDRMNKYAAGGRAQGPTDTLEKYYKDSGSINLGLANSKSLSKDQRKSLASDVKDLRKLKSPVPPQVYSAISSVAFDAMAQQVGFNKKVMDGVGIMEQDKVLAAETQKIVGKAFKLPGFLSTSKDYSVAKMFLDNAPRSDKFGAMLTINTKQNAQGIDTVGALGGRKINATKTEIDPRSGKPTTYYMKQPDSEKEVILQPRSRFKINSAKFAGFMGGSKNLWMDVQQFEKGGQAQQNDPMTFGLAALFGEGYDPAPVRTPKTKQKVILKSGVMPHNQSLEYQSMMIDGFKDTIVKVGSKFASGVGAAIDTSGPKLDAIIKNTGLGNIVGSALEGSLGVAGAPFVEKTRENQSIDFPGGLGPIASKFGLPAGIPTDATRTAGGKGKTFNDFLGQVDRFIMKTQGIAASTNDKTKTPTTQTSNVSLGSIFSGLKSGESISLTEIQKRIPGTKAKQIDLSQFGLTTNRAGGKTNFVKRATGGGISSQDTVPALLTPGEYVINKEAASRIGLSNLHQLNRADKIQGFNKGGVVQKFADGGGVYKIAQDIKQREPWRTTEDILKEARQIVSDQTTPKADNSAAQRTRTQQKAAARGINYVATGLSPSRQSNFNAFNATANAVQTQAATAANTYGPPVNPQQQARYQNQSARAGGQVNMSTAGAQFATQIASVKTPMQQLVQNLTMMTKAVSTPTAALTTLGNVTKAAGSALGNMAKSAGSSIGQGIGGGISRIGGGVLNAVGLGRFSSAGRAGGAGAAGGVGGGFGGMAGMMLTMGGGMAVDSLSKAYGGEKTDTGRKISSVGGNMLNYGATGAAIGSMFGPIGTGVGAAVGALAGLTIGLQEAEKAGQEYATAQNKAAADVSSEKSGQALNKYMTDGGASNRSAFMRSFAETSAAEAKTNAGIKRERASSFGKMLGYTDEDTETLSKRKAEAEKAGADQASQFLANEMMKSGKTFDQLSKSMDPAEFQMLANNMAEADYKYISFQEQRANEIAKLKDQGRTAEANQLQEQTNKESAEMAKNLARRQLAETSAAAQAKAVADANKQLAQAAVEAAETITERFAKASAALDLVSVAMKAAADRSKEIMSGRSSAVSIGLTTDIAKMKNEAVPIQQRKAMMGKYAGRLGDTGREALNMVDFADNAKKAAKEAASNTKREGTVEQQNEMLGSNIQRSLINQINATFGPGSAMANKLISGVKASVDTMVKNAKDTALTAEEILENASGPLVNASEQAANLLIKQAEKMAEAFELISDNSKEIASLEQQQKDRLIDLNDKIRANAMAYTEAIGGRVNSRERLNNRLARVGQTVGINRGNPVNTAAIVGQRDQLRRDADNLTRQRDAAQAAGNAGAAASFDLQLKRTEQQLNSVTTALGSLPDVLQESIGDVLGEIQERVADIEARKEAGAGFAEKLVGSTPQELFELNRTYALMTNTLRGNITSIQQSADAQKAYIMALREGKTQQEAYADAQVAFANKNKEALSLFNELTQVAGVKGPQFDVMRADLLENFAKAQGMGMQNNPMFREIIAELRRSPEERAQRDPTIQALTGLFNQLQVEQQRAVQALNILDATVAQGLQAQTADIVRAINDGAPGQGLARGGMVYASRGRFINFEPKGTDTVPAMLTPGEFVVNAQSTKDNLPLLQAINSGYYAQGGKIPQKPGAARNEKELLQFSRQNTLNRLNQTAQENLLYGIAYGQLVKKLSGDPVSIADSGDPKTNKEEFIAASAAVALENIAFASRINEGKFRLINSKQFAMKQYGEYNKMSPAEKLLYEFNEQKRVQPDAFGPEAFLLDYNRYEEGLAKAFLTKNIPELFRAASKRVNYLREIIANLNMALGVIGNEDGSDMFKNQEQNAATELANIEKAWVVLKNRRIRPPMANAGQLEFPQLQNMDSFPKDQTRGFDPMQPPPSKQYFARGGVVYANNGMMIPYAPKGSDTIPAMLTPGEFVVNRSASQRNLGLLQAINSGQYNKGGSVSYLAEGTPGIDAFSTSMKLLTDAITIGAEKLNTAFLEATRQLNGLSNGNNNRSNTTTQNGVSNNTVANIDILGSKLDRFIEQLQAAIPPVIRVEGQHEVNVVINGASVLQQLLQGPLSSIVQKAIDSAFNRKSRENEGN